MTAVTTTSLTSETTTTSTQLHLRNLFDIHDTTKEQQYVINKMSDLNYGFALVAKQHSCKDGVNLRVSTEDFVVHICACKRDFCND